MMKDNKEKSCEKEKNIWNKTKDNKEGGVIKKKEKYEKRKKKSRIS